MPPADASVLDATQSPLLESWQVLDFMVALVEKSLVVFDENNGSGQSDGAGRYRLLETTRQYGAERLAHNPEEAEAQRRRHRAYYLHFAEKIAPHLNGVQAAPYLKSLAADHDNIRTALNGFVDAATAQTGATALVEGGRLCAALTEFWSIRGFFKEGRDYCQTFLNLDTPSACESLLPPNLRAHLLRACGSFSGYLDEFDASEACLSEALTLDQAAQNHNGVGAALVTLGVMAKHKGNLQAARDLFDEGLKESRLGGDGRAIAVALTNVAHMVTDNKEKTALHEECLAIFRKQGDSWGVAQSLGNLGWIKQMERDEAGAFAYYEECRALREALGDRHGLGWLHRGIASTAIARGDRESAMAAYREGIQIFQSISNREGIGWMQYYAAMMPVGDGLWPDGQDEAAQIDLRDALKNFAAIKEPVSIRFVLEALAFRLVLSNPEKAAVLYGAGQRLRDELGGPIETGEPVQPKARALARAALGDDGWEAAFARGLALPTDEAVELALETAPATG